jgi:hypothetical protein
VQREGREGERERQTETEGERGRGGERERERGRERERARERGRDIWGWRMLSGGGLLGSGGVGRTGCIDDA